ncbi:MAG: Hpt domain-containing protein [Phycisphaerales bacterium]
MNGTSPNGPRPQIKSEFADDPDMREIVEFFVNDLGDRVAAISAAFQSDDLSRLRTLAHQLKGAAGGYGFPAIGMAAATVERELLADQATLSALSEKVEDLLRLCRAAMPDGNQ